MINDGFIDMWDGWAKKRRGVPVYDLWLDEYETLLKGQSREILDLGCGNGADTLYLINKKYKVISCDFSKEALQNVKDNIPHSKTKYLNMQEKFPFEDERFSVIIADLSLHYFDEITTFQIMHEIKRVLKTGGYLLARVAAVENIPSCSGWEEIEHNFYFEGDYAKRFFDDKDVKRFFGEIGEIEYKKVAMTRNEEEYLNPRIVYQIKVKKMKVEKINEIFSSKEIKSLLSQIAAENDYRMCLNKEVMEEYRRFFADLIACSFVVDVENGDLIEIYNDVERYLAKKLSHKLGIKNVYDHKDKVAEYFNKVLGYSQIYFHGTLSSMENSILGQKVDNYIKVQLCKNINDIYCKYGIYAAFESGIRDFESNSFWIARSPDSACFYALQSPEYFARFCSRSDYYKQDIFKYDRIAYYRKDFGACKRNIKTEIKDFNFSRQERKSILKNFKALWQNVVAKDMDSVIFMCKVDRENIHNFAENENLMEALSKFFRKENFRFDLQQFKNCFIGKIVLPDVKPYLKRQHPLINKKFVVYDNKKYYPDFYVDCKYAEHLYFSFDNSNVFKTVQKDAALNERKLLIRLVNEARANTKAARRFFKTQKLPSVDDVVAYYRQEFSKKVAELEKEEDLAAKMRIVKRICEDVGLKYVVSLKYKQFFKDINQYYIKTYRSLLGVKFFEYYEGLCEATCEKINRLLELYKKILSGREFFKDDLPLLAFKHVLEYIS